MKESNKDFDKDLIRINLQNKELFLIITLCYVTAVNKMP